MDTANQLLKEISAKHRYFPELGEAWQHRHLSWVLARRNLKLRYAQTILGSVWIVIQPVLLAGMLTAIFGLLITLPTDGVPYALFAFAGTTLWSAFQRALIDTGISMAGNSAIILKVYFPRILVPLASVLTAVVDFLPVYALLILVTVIGGQLSGWPILLSPFFAFIALLLAFGAGLWTTALDAIFRDIRLVVPTIMQLVFYATPIMYSESVVPQRWRLLYHLNPFVGIIQGFRWSIIAGAHPPDIAALSWSIVFVGLCLVTGLMLFARLETFAVDRI
jgi:homopolymeric O-antigen transport system permease protein